MGVIKSAVERIASKIECFEKKNKNEISYTILFKDKFGVFLRIKNKNDATLSLSTEKKIVRSLKPKGSIKIPFERIMERITSIPGQSPKMDAEMIVFGQILFEMISSEIKRQNIEIDPNVFHEAAISHDTNQPMIKGIKTLPFNH